MTVVKLQPRDSTFTYKGTSIQVRNFVKNKFTGTWSFDLYYPNGFLLGVPISAGTNVVKGNGTPFRKFVFVDNISPTGDITYPANTTLYVMED